MTLTVSNSSLKQSCSVRTSVTSALEVNLNNMRYINLHFTYLLTDNQLTGNLPVCLCTYAYAI